MAAACVVQCSVSVATVGTPMPLVKSTRVEAIEAARDGSGFNVGYVDYKSTTKTGLGDLADLHGEAASLRLSSPPVTLAFVYGTLKQGFSNHWLIEDVVSKGHACFIGVAKTKQRYPLVCGPFQVPFLVNMPSRGCTVKGELYAVDSAALELLDELEGVTKGHYERHPLKLTSLQSLQLNYPMDADIQAAAYFAASPLTQGLARAPHLESYTKKETVNYIHRKDRPQDRTFLEHVHHWIETHESATARV